MMCANPEPAERQPANHHDLRIFAAAPGEWILFSYMHSGYIKVTLMLRYK